MIALRRAAPRYRIVPMSSSNDELLRLLDGGESDRVECKAELGDNASQREIRKTLCAFANDLPRHGKPGVLFLGVDDDGSPVGAPLPKRLGESIGNWPRDGSFNPHPDLRVQTRNLRGDEVCVVEVSPHSAPPVTWDNRVWVRIGRTTQAATSDQERTLVERRRAGDVWFDLHAVPSARLGDLDLDRFRLEYLPILVSEDVLAENERPVEQQLAALRFATHGPEPTPTVLGILLLAYSPTQFLPGAYVRFLRFEGDDVTSDVLDERRIEGPLVDVIRRTEECLQSHNAVRANLSGSTDVRTPAYPRKALEEVLRNALIHRNYEGTAAPVHVYWFADRLEIVSPGGPAGRVTPDNFGQAYAVDYRNPHLAGTLPAFGLVQQFGVGLALAANALADNGNPSMEQDPSSDRVRIVLRPVP